MRLFELDWLLGEKKEASHCGGLFVFRPISSAFHPKSHHYLLLHIRTLVRVLRVRTEQFTLC